VPKNLSPQVIFTAGTHTASDGSTHTFTVADLQECAAAYDPHKHTAPWCLGHPKTNGPAWGWIQKLQVVGNKLVAFSEKIAGPFLDWVETGHFLKKSASFYLPQSPNNPTPGKLYLRHVAALGAQPPAVKGLPDLSTYDYQECQSTADFEESVDFSMTEWGWLALSRMARNLREMLIEEKGPDKANTVIPEQTISDLEAAAREESQQKPNYEEPTTVSQATNEREALTTEITRLKTQIDAQKHAAFLEKLCSEGRILDFQKPGIGALMSTLSQVPDTIEFGEGTEKQTQTLLQFFEGLISQIPKQVDFSERAKSQIPGKMSPEEIAAKASEYAEDQRKAGRTVNYTQAVNHVMKGQDNG